MKLPEAVSHYIAIIEATRAEATHRAYASILHRWLAAAQDLNGVETIDDLDDEHIALIRDPSTSVATRDLQRSVLRQFWAWLETDADGTHLSAARAARYLQTERHKTLSDLDVELVEQTRDLALAQARTAARPANAKDRAAVIAYLTTLRDAALIELLATTGVRISEALGLSRADIAWHSDPPSAAVMSKGRQRWIFLPPSSTAAIDAYLTARDQLQPSRLSLERQPVFVGHASNADPTGLSSRRAQQICRSLSIQALERLGDDPDRRRPLHPHDFRHYQITQVWRQTGDLHLAQTLAGHADPRTTASYTHASREDLGDRVRRAWKNNDADDTPPDTTEPQDT